MPECLWTAIAVLFAIFSLIWAFGLWVALGPRKPPPRCEASQESIDNYERIQRLLRKYEN
jgi:hypothetical protein